MAEEIKVGKEGIQLGWRLAAGLAAAFLGTYTVSQVLPLAKDLQASSATIESQGRRLAALEGEFNQLSLQHVREVTELQQKVASLERVTYQKFRSEQRGQ